MPIFLLGLGAGAIGSFVVSDGLDEVRNILLIALLLWGAFLVSKKMGLI